MFSKTDGMFVKPIPGLVMVRFVYFGVLARLTQRTKAARLSFPRQSQTAPNTDRRPIPSQYGTGIPQLKMKVPVDLSGIKVGIWENLIPPLQVPGTVY